MGHYYISNLPAQTYLFTVSYVNTKSWAISISLTSDTVINAILKEKYNALKAVTVYGQKEFERKADRFIYTPNKSIAEGNSAIDLMRYVPLIQYDEKTNAFSIIGKSGTTVYINNRKTAEILSNLKKSKSNVRFSKIIGGGRKGDRFSCSTEIEGAPGMKVYFEGK